MHRAAALLLLLLASAACQRSPEAVPEPAAARPASASPGAAVVVAHPVVWPPASSIDRAALASLPPAAQGAVALSTLPVLVPGVAELRDGAVVIAKPRWFALSQRGGGLTLSIGGTAVSHAYPAVAPIRGDTEIRGSRGFVTQNERIWSATWQEGTVSYSVDVECASPDDARCLTDAFILRVARGLVYVGGAGAEAAK